MSIWAFLARILLMAGVWAGALCLWLSYGAPMLGLGRDLHTLSLGVFLFTVLLVFSWPVVRLFVWLRHRGEPLPEPCPPVEVPRWLRVCWWLGLASLLVGLSALSLAALLLALRMEGAVCLVSPESPFSWVARTAGVRAAARDRTLGRVVVYAHAVSLESREGGRCSARKAPDADKVRVEVELFLLPASLRRVFAAVGLGDGARLRGLKILSAEGEVSSEADIERLRPIVSDWVERGLSSLPWPLVRISVVRLEAGLSAVPGGGMDIVLESGEGGRPVPRMAPAGPSNERPGRVGGDGGAAPVPAGTGRTAGGTGSPPTTAASSTLEYFHMSVRSAAAATSSTPAAVSPGGDDEIRGGASGGR